MARPCDPMPSGNGPLLVIRVGEPEGGMSELRDAHGMLVPPPAPGHLRLQVRIEQDSKAAWVDMAVSAWERVQTRAEDVNRIRCQLLRNLGRDPAHPQRDETWWLSADPSQAGGLIHGP